MLELLSDNGKIILFLLAGILAVAGYVLRQHVNTVTTLNKEAVRQQDLREMKAERDRLHQENAARLDAIHETVAATSKSISDMGILSHRVLTLEKDVLSLRDFKHNSVEPAVRYIEFLGKEKPWDESKTHLARLEIKIDANEEKASESRHKSINDLQVILAGIEALRAERKSR